MSKPTPLNEAIGALTTELAEQARDRRDTPERRAEVAARLAPLRPVGRRGMLGMLMMLPGWWEAFTQIADPPMDGSALRCTCGNVLELRDRDLVGCGCHRFFLWSRGEVFVTYGEPAAAEDDP